MCVCVETEARGRYQVSFSTDILTQLSPIVPGDQRFGSYSLTASASQGWDYTLRFYMLGVQIWVPMFAHHALTD